MANIILSGLLISPLKKLSGRFRNGIRGKAAGWREF
jgi:hypothetical protein